MANMLEIIIFVILIKIYVKFLFSNLNTKKELIEKIKDINNTKFYYLNEEIVGIPRDLLEEDTNYHPILMNKSVIYTGLKRDTNLTNNTNRNIESDI
jgi:uncharacterized transporter YbjL